VLDGDDLTCRRLSYLLPMDLCLQRIVFWHVSQWMSCSADVCCAIGLSFA